MHRCIFFLLCFSLSSTSIFAIGSQEVSEAKNNQNLQALQSYIRIWKLNKRHYDKDGEIVAKNIPMDLVKKHILDAGFNWELVTQFLYPAVKEAVYMLNQTNKGIAPNAAVSIQDYLQKEYLFDQFEELASLRDPRRFVQIAQLNELLEKVSEGTVVIILLDGLILDAEGDNLSLLAIDAKEVIDAMIAKGVVVLGYTNAGYLNVSRIGAFLESKEIHFSRLGNIRSLGLDDNEGIQDGILAGRNLPDVVKVFQNVDNTINLAKGESVNIVFVTDKDVIAERIREDAKELKADTMILQCTYIANQSEMEKLVND